MEMLSEDVEVFDHVPYRFDGKPLFAKYLLPKRELESGEFDLAIAAYFDVRLTRTYMRSMLQRGRGGVIFISSEVALRPMAAMAHYSASKATQLSISRSLAELTQGPVAVLYGSI